ncbi:hypothetical protein HDU76_011414, partial [Blyttiomyces sp. JEL0837]
MNHTDIATRFINNQPLTESEIEEKAHEIWRTVINTNSWDLDLSILPKDKFPTILNGVNKVNRIDAYHQLYKMRPDLAGIDHLQTLIKSSNFWNILGLDYREDSFSFNDIHQNEIPKLLINIPMRQFWMDELTELDNLDQRALFVIAGSCGHLELFQHLYKKIYLNGTPSINSEADSIILLLAAERGFIDIIQFIFTNFEINIYSYIKYEPKSLPGFYNTTSTTTQAIYKAFHNGHLDIIKLLISLPNDDPTLTQYPKFLSGAVHHLDVMKFLLWDIPGVDK